MGQSRQQITYFPNEVLACSNDCWSSAQSNL